MSAGRPIPVLAQHTFPGNVILASRATSGLAPPSLPDPELEKLCLAHLAGVPGFRVYKLGFCLAPLSLPDPKLEQLRLAHLAGVLVFCILGGSL